MTDWFGNDPNRDTSKIDVYVHYGGHFVDYPTPTYTSNQVAVFNDWEVDKISKETLLDLYQTVEAHTNPRIFFQVPCLDLDVGVVPILNDQDVELLVTSYRGMAQMHIYVENADVPIISSENNQAGTITGHRTLYLTYGDSDSHVSSVGNDGGGHKDVLDDQLYGSQSNGGAVEYLTDDDGWYNDSVGHGKPSSETSEEDILRGCPSGDDIVVTEWNEEVIDDHDLLDTVLYDDLAARGKEHPEFDADVEFSKSEFDLKVGQKFASFKAFRAALVEWHVREGFEFTCIKNESNRITAVCKRRHKKESDVAAKGKSVKGARKASGDEARKEVVCHWRIHASPIQGTTTFQIKSLTGPHVCGREYTNAHATSTYLSHKMHPSFADNPDMPVQTVVRAVRRNCMLDISKRKAYRTKYKANATLRGIDMVQYHRARDYAEQLLKHNPGSRVNVRVNRYADDADAVFHIMYFSLKAMAEGFVSGCRPIIGLDGCFLKSPFGGQLLTDMGRDGNDNMFPIALAVVEAETFDSWAWFLEEFRDQLGEGTPVTWTFISDRQKGHVHAINRIFPQSAHRYCLRHMYQNFKKRFKGQELKNLFWAAASACNKYDFERAMTRLEQADPKRGDQTTAAEWLRRLPLELWSRAHFRLGCKSDILVNNLNESFNNFILPARDKPIITMFEWIRRSLMQRMLAKRSGMGQDTGNVCPNIQSRIEKYKRLSRHCCAIYASNGEYEVESGSVRLLVDLERRQCTCGYFQLTGIPCPHAIASIHKHKRQVEDYVDPCYNKDAYMRAYGESIRGIPSMEYWDSTPSDPIRPPIVKKQPGRPKKLRRREANEPPRASTRRGLTVHCKRCFKTGHNSRTCKNAVHPKSKFYKAPSTNGTTSNNPAVEPANANRGGSKRKGQSLSQPGHRAKSIKILVDKHQSTQPTVGSTSGSFAGAA